MSFRVPTVDVSVVDLTVKLAKETTYEEVETISNSITHESDLDSQFRADLKNGRKKVIKQHFQM